MKHFDTNKILTDTQHGFRKKRSTESQLLITVQEIVKRLATESHVDIILLDFVKSFDKVPHSRLMH
jgi:transcriptional regulator NrdR family protein